jgi:hypothetical protein
VRTPFVVAAGQRVAVRCGLVVAAVTIVSGAGRMSVSVRVCDAVDAVENATTGGVTLTSRTSVAVTVSGNS